jgi:apolipoprotein D and lipocalin family protein
MNKVLVGAVVVSIVAALSSCASYGPPPETVPFVDVEKYAGKWYEIATNPVFFNKNLVGVTAEYGVISNTQISVLNTGYQRTLDGKKQTITGKATVVDTATNSKLQVRFDRFPVSLFPGNYWIVVLDAENYQYAVVTDDKQKTMFVLARDPFMSRQLYDQILAELQSKSIDISRLRITGEIRD